MNAAPLGWFGVIRLGLVQTALGAIFVLATATLNRVMVVELALPALVPGGLVALQYAVQVLRPRLGHGSDGGARRTPWIIGGMAILAAGGVLAALATSWMAADRPAGIALAVLAYVLIGLGVGAAGTSVLAMLAKRTPAPRRAAAATIVWLMMIAGFVITAGSAGKLLDPFSLHRLVAVMAAVSLVALLVSVLAVWNIEGPAEAAPAQAHAAPVPFRQALADVWSDRDARRLTVFIFVSMLAYSAQELILEPFAGAVFGFTPGQSAQLSGMQHGGVLLGMILVGIAGSVLRGSWLGAMRTWTTFGCIASAAALLALVVAGFVGPAWPLRQSVFLLGLANGAFSIAAIGSMMALAGGGKGAREGVRMGLWGAAQALAFGVGGLLATGSSDLARSLIAAPGLAYAAVFSIEAALFLIAAGLAIGLRQPGDPEPAVRAAGVGYAAELSQG